MVFKENFIPLLTRKALNLAVACWFMVIEELNLVNILCSSFVKRSTETQCLIKQFYVLMLLKENKNTHSMWILFSYKWHNHHAHMGWVKTNCCSFIFLSQNNTRNIKEQLPQRKPNSTSSISSLVRHIICDYCVAHKTLYCSDVNSTPGFWESVSGPRVTNAGDKQPFLVQSYRSLDVHWATVLCSQAAAGWEMETFQNWSHHHHPLDYHVRHSHHQSLS